MDTVRFGIIGYGGMGGNHGLHFAKDTIQTAALTAVRDIDAKRLDIARETHGDDLQLFDKAEDLIAADCCDAVLIATPHYDHPPIAIAAFAKGLHVLSEKPTGVYTRQVAETNAAADSPAGRCSYVPTGETRRAPVGSESSPCHSERGEES